MRRSCAAMLLFGAASGPAFAADPGGDWMVADKTAVIRVAPCPPAASPRPAAPPTYCGAIIWTKGPPGTDRNNPDPAKRERSVIGLQIISDMKAAAAPNKWEGEIYNAEDGKTYSASVALTNENVLRVKGCVLGILCGGEDWTKARCETAKSATPNRREAPAVTSCRELAPQPPSPR